MHFDEIVLAVYSCGLFLLSFLRETPGLLVHLELLVKMVPRECVVMLVPQVEQEMLDCVDLLAHLERKERPERMVPLLVSLLSFNIPSHSSLHFQN